MFRRYLFAEKMVLPFAAWFDRRAAPYEEAPALRLQLLGYPILANDLPQIPPWPTGELWAAQSADR